MKTTIKITIIIMSMMLFKYEAFAHKSRNTTPVRVLLVTGGHDFDRENFYPFVNSIPGCTVTEVKHPDALVMLKPENRASYDVILFYDMPKSITEEEQKDFIDCLNAGKGIVVWHHAYCSYQEWTEYQNIIGGRYHETPWTDSNGVAQPASTYEYNVPLSIKVVDGSHPVTRGIRDFEIIDEAYGRGVVNPGVHILLATDNPKSTPSVAWAHQYGKSKIVTVILGHDNKAWSYPSFAKFLEQAIMWVKD